MKNASPPFLYIFNKIHKLCFLEFFIILALIFGITPRHSGKFITRTFSFERAYARTIKKNRPRGKERKVKKRKRTCRGLIPLALPQTLSLTGGITYPAACVWEYHSFKIVLYYTGFFFRRERVRTALKPLPMQKGGPGTKGKCKWL